jgi:YVTN family beta-propeller protein
MNRKLGLIVTICAALIGLSVLNFGVSSYSAIAEQPGEPEVAMKENTLENEIQHSRANIGSLAYVPMGNENGLALIDTVLHTTVDSVDLAQYGCNHPLRARLNPDGTELYVTCEYSDNIIVLDTAGLALVAVIDRPGACQQDVAFVQAG